MKTVPVSYTNNRPISATSAQNAIGAGSSGVAALAARDQACGSV